MNFKVLVMIAFLTGVLYACGVKGPPSPPPGTAIPSYTEKFLDSDSATKTK